MIEQWCFVISFLKNCFLLAKFMMCIRFSAMNGMKIVLWPVPFEMCLLAGCLGSFQRKPLGKHPIWIASLISTNFLGAFGRKRSKHKNLSHSIVRTPRPEMRMDSVLKTSICGNITWFNLIWSNTNQKTSWGNQKTSKNLDLLCEFVGILVYYNFQIAKGNASSLFVSAMLLASFT